jgi:hypothetical protein
VWIGYPNDIREIPNPRRGVKLVKDLNQATHSTLSGAVRTTGRRRTPRTWSAEWPWLAAEHAAFLHRLTSKLYGPGPFVVVDPSTTNYLSPHQSVGRGRIDQWTISNGAVAALATGELQWNRSADGTLTWRHPVWPGWPARPGWTVAFAHTAAGVATGLSFLDAAGAALSTVTGGAGSVSGTVPAGAQWVQPYLAATGAGSLIIPDACLDYRPIGSTWTDGQHAACMSMTTAAEEINRRDYRNVSLELVEV